MKNYFYFLVIFLLVSCNSDKIVRHRFQGVVCDANTKIPIVDVTISAIESSYYMGRNGDTVTYSMFREGILKTDFAGRYVIPEIVVNEGGYRELREISKKTPHIFFLKKENYQPYTVYLRKYTRNNLYEKKIILYTVDTVFLKRIEK